MVWLVRQGAAAPLRNEATCAKDPSCALSMDPATGTLSCAVLSQRVSLAPTLRSEPGTRGQQCHSRYSCDLFLFIAFRSCSLGTEAPLAPDAQPIRAYCALDEGVLRKSRAGIMV